MKKRFYNKALFIFNIICGVLVAIIGILLLSSGIFVSIVAKVIPPFIILSLLSSLFLFLAYYYFIVVKTKLMNLTTKQERKIDHWSVISIIVFGMGFISAMIIIIGILIYGPLVEQGFLYCFIGEALLSSILVLNNFLIRIYLNRKNN